MLSSCAVQAVGRARVWVSGLEEAISDESHGDRCQGVLALAINHTAKSPVPLLMFTAFLSSSICA